MGSWIRGHREGEKLVVDMSTRPRLGGRPGVDWASGPDWVMPWFPTAGFRNRGSDR